MVEKRCFLQWFVLTLGYVVAAFFCWRYGVIQSVYVGDSTHMTSVIAAVFTLTCLYQGFASWRLPQPLSYENASADVGIGRAAGFLVTLIGLLGTAIGLMWQVKAMGAVNVSDPASIVGFISTIGSALSTALYATASGIVACVGITVLNTNLEFFVDREEGV